MRRMTLTLVAVVALTGIYATTAQANTSMPIAGSLASQTLAYRGGHHGGHYGRHHGGYYGGHHRRHGGYYGGYYGYRHYPPVYRQRYYARPYNSFYYSGRGFSFGFGY